MAVRGLRGPSAVTSGGPLATPCSRSERWISRWAERAEQGGSAKTGPKDAYTTYPMRPCGHLAMPFAVWAGQCPCCVPGPPISIDQALGGGQRRISASPIRAASWPSPRAREGRTEPSSNANAWGARALFQSSPGARCNQERTKSSGVGYQRRRGHFGWVPKGSGHGQRMKESPSRQALTT